VVKIEKASNAKTRMACFHPVNSLAVYLKKGSFDGGPQNKLSSFSICNNNNKVTQARCQILLTAPYRFNL
jgi:hypothetical protein